MKVNYDTGCCDRIAGGEARILPRDGGARKTAKRKWRTSISAQAIYAYCDTTTGGKFLQKFWNEIESSTTKNRPFYENEYITCTVNCVPDSFWKVSKIYDNVHIVLLKMLFATYKKEYNKVAHPKFVPSFVK